jgi:hypothetical protein
MILYRIGQEFILVFNVFIGNEKRSWTLIEFFHRTILPVKGGNCTCVDWTGGSCTGYTQATQTVQVWVQKWHIST